MICINMEKLEILVYVGLYILRQIDIARLNKGKKPIFNGVIDMVKASEHETPTKDKNDETPPLK